MQGRRQTQRGIDGLTKAIRVVLELFGFETDAKQFSTHEIVESGGEQQRERPRIVGTNQPSREETLSFWIVFVSQLFSGFLFKGSFSFPFPFVSIGNHPIRVDSSRRRNVEKHHSRRAHCADEAHVRLASPWRCGCGGSRGWSYWVRVQTRTETKDGRRWCVEGRGGRDTDHVEDASVPRCTRVQESLVPSDNLARCA